MQPPRDGPSNRRVSMYRCQATGCQHEIPRDHLMCLDHWRMVPAPLRRDVWAAWRMLCRRPSLHSLRAYQVVRRQAIDAVEAKDLQKLAARNGGGSTPQLF